MAFSENLSMYNFSYKLGDFAKMVGKTISEKIGKIILLLICGSNDSKVSNK
jgi:hypothetical protein